MPTCEKCGTRIQSGRLCRTHELSRLGPQTDETVYECPECGGETSGEGYACYRCRGDA